METNGPVKPSETPSPVDLILQQKKDVLQGLPQVGGGDGGNGNNNILAQLSSNPFFTAVSQMFLFSVACSSLLLLLSFQGQRKLRVLSRVLVWLVWAPSRHSPREASNEVPT